MNNKKTITTRNVLMIAVAIVGLFLFLSSGDWKFLAFIIVIDVMIYKRVELLIWPKNKKCT